MTNQSRRRFIGNAAAAGLSGCFLPVTGTTAVNSVQPEKRLKNNSVILFQGDSITDGNRGRNEDPNHIMGHGYAFSIASRVGVDFPKKNYKFYNRGISGHKITDLADRWQKDTLDLNPDILSILVGVNDAASVVFSRPPVVTVEKYEETYDALLQQTRDINPEILFILCEPFILKVGKVAENWEVYHADIDKRREVVKKLAAKFDAVFVPSQETFNDACKKAPAEYWMWDGVHPTVAGHELLAREWMNQVEKRISF
ncbi:MAG: SGNH/GDSL hydrolase family protein [Draconibacterium sp.]